ALALMPNAPLLLAFAPLAMGAFILLIKDLSFNVTMQPFRALVADMLEDSQKTKGYVVQTFLINLGAVVGAVLPLILTRCGISDEVVPGQVAQHIAWSYYIGGAILLATVLVTAFKTKEYPPEEFAEYNGESVGEAFEKPSFLELMRNVPKVMLQLGVVQFFSWAALFLMWTYLKPAISGVATCGGALLSEGELQTWVGVLNGTYPVPACIASLFIAGIAAKWGNKLVYALCLLCGAAGFAGLCLLSDKYALMIPMIGIGVAWAGILAMPYAILSRAVEARRMGVYMGIFNFTITVPQIVVGLTGGLIVKCLFGQNAVAMIELAGAFMLLAAISVVFVREK
ncbi:MAG: MFS transporter, partial [Alistipes sp.]|nr:MFS transporter [Alistipes sp.]